MNNVEELIETAGGIPWGVNSWGSSQYTSALNMFTALEKLSQKYGKDEALKRLNIFVAHKGVSPLVPAWNGFRKEMIERAKEMEYDKKEMADLVAWFNKTPPSVDAMFERLRSSAWDLWGAAPYVANIMFKHLEVKTSLDESGPNYVTGLYCWILWNQDLIKGNAEDVFGDFDT